MKKITFSISDKRTFLVFGSALFGFELVIFILLLLFDSTLAVSILSMISANHLGGRMAFIGVGFEFGLPSSLIILVILLYNTTYLFILNFLMAHFQEKIQKVKFFHRHIESLNEIAEMRAQCIKKWRWIGIVVFVWLPLPMTGAVIGSIIAYIERYNIKNTLLMVIPSMWLGVICWTLWYNKFYTFTDQFGKGRTFILTLSLIFLPLLYYLLNIIKKTMKTRGREEKDYGDK